MAQGNGDGIRNRFFREVQLPGDVIVVQTIFPTQFKDQLLLGSKLSKCISDEIAGIIYFNIIFSYFC